MRKALQFTFFTMIIRSEKGIFFLYQTYHMTILCSPETQKRSYTISSKILLEDYRAKLGTPLSLKTFQLANLGTNAPNTMFLWKKKKCVLIFQLTDEFWDENI